MDFKRFSGICFPPRLRTMASPEEYYRVPSVDLGFVARIESQRSALVPIWSQRPSSSAITATMPLAITVPRHRPPPGPFGFSAAGNLSHKCGVAAHRTTTPSGLISPYRAPVRLFSGIAPGELVLVFCRPGPDAEDRVQRSSAVSIVIWRM